MKTFHLANCILCVAACLWCAEVCHATPLLAGATLYPAPGEPDPTVGAPLASMSVPFSAAPLYSGTLKSEVYNNDISNPYGGLTFVYQVSNDLVSLDPIHRLTINNFSGFSIDASYQIGSGLAATLIDRSAAGTVGFGFFGSPVGPGAIAPGITTALLVLQTNASTFVTTFASVIDGTVNSVPSFSPSHQIPEPSGAILLALGAGGLAVYAYRHRRPSRRLAGRLES